jgi:hypothetical protein
MQSYCSCFLLTKAHTSKTRREGAFFGTTTMSQYVESIMNFEKFSKIISICHHI